MDTQDRQDVLDLLKRMDAPEDEGTGKTPERYFILTRQAGKPWSEYNSTPSLKVAQGMVGILQEQGLEACIEEDIALYDPISMVWNRVTA